MNRRVYHVEVPYQPKHKKVRPVVGRKKMIEQLPEDMTWKGLVKNGLCMGLNSPCVKGECDVMCGYGKRYLKEKDLHAG